MIEYTLLQFDLFGIFSDINAFMLLFIGVGAAFGAFSRKLSISAFGALLVYVHVVIETDLFIFDAILYLVLIIILLFVSVQIVSGYIEGSGGSSPEPEGEG